jgi:hypothetical protein
MKSIVKRVQMVTRPTGSWGRGSFKKKGSEKRKNAAGLIRSMRKDVWKRGLDNIPGMRGKRTPNR